MTIGIDRKRIGIWLLLLLLPLGNAWSQALEINIVGGNPSALPIAVVPFEYTGVGVSPDTDVSSVIRADLNRSGKFRGLPDQDIIEKPADWAGWTLPAVCIVSADWRPRDPAHGAGGYVYDRLYEYRLIAITRGARMTAVADARAILERIETRVKGWNQSRATITGLTTGDAVQTFGVDRGGVLIYHAQSSDPDVKFGVGGLIITARVMTR